MPVNFFVEKLMPRFAACLLVISFIGPSSCEVEQQLPVPVITSIDPGTGYAGDEVTINGGNFDPADTQVTFGNQSATLLSTTVSKIVVEVPIGTGGTVVSVTAFGQTIAGPTFLYKIKQDKTEEPPKLVPQITLIDPQAGYQGDEVTITGKNFDPASTQIIFGNQPAISLSVTESKVVVRVPTGTGNPVVSATAFGQTVFGPAFFYKPVGPTSTIEPKTTNLELTSVRLTGYITALGRNEITQHGFVVYPNGVDPLAGMFVENGPKIAPGAFTLNINALTKNTTYTANSFARTSDGVFLSPPITFKTLNTNQWVVLDYNLTYHIPSHFGQVTVTFPSENSSPAINGKAYIFPIGVAGALLGGAFEFDPAAGTITPKAYNNTILRARPVRFAIGDQLYAGMGDVDAVNERELWRFTPATNTTVRVRDFPGAPMVNAISVVLNGKAYVGFGWRNGGFEMTFWEYDPAADSWTQKSSPINDGPLSIICVLMAQPVNDKGYFVFRRGTEEREVWEYSPTNDTWLRKNDLVLDVLHRSGDNIHPYPGISMGGNAYLVNPEGNFWKYTPSTDTWTTFPSPQALTPASFTTLINGRIYVGQFGAAPQMYIVE